MVYIIDREREICVFWEVEDLSYRFSFFFPYVRTCICIRKRIYFQRGKNRGMCLQRENCQDALSKDIRYISIYIQQYVYKICMYITLDGVPRFVIRNCDRIIFHRVTRRLDPDEYQNRCINHINT